MNLRLAALVGLSVFTLGCEQAEFSAVYVFTQLRAGSDGRPVPVVLYAVDDEGRPADGSVRLTGTAGAVDGAALREGVSVEVANGVGRTTFGCDLGTDSACAGVVTLEANFGGKVSQAFIRIEDPQFADRKPGMYPDPAGVVSVLRQLRWEFPCFDAEAICATEAAETDAMVMPGGQGVLYEVTFRFRGLVETLSYYGGSARGLFHVGGSYPSGSTANVYAISVSEPARSYFLNHAPFRVCPTVVDYEDSIVVAGGSRVSLVANSLDGYQLANRDCDNGPPLLVPGVAPYPEPYNGQFLQADVVGVRLVPCSEQPGPSCL